LPTTCQRRHLSFRRRNRRKRRQASRQSGSNQRANCNGRRPLLCFLQRNHRSRPPPRRQSRKAPRGNPRRLRRWCRRSCLVAGPKHRHPDVLHADARPARLHWSSAGHVLSMIRAPFRSDQKGVLRPDRCEHWFTHPRTPTTAQRKTPPAAWGFAGGASLQVDGSPAGSAGREPTHLIAVCHASIKPRLCRATA
jgi:hypothetical protein